MKYNVIIVGGGNAGCALAARLSDDPQRSVLLLEAGPEYPQFSLLPNDLKYSNNPLASAMDAPHNWSFEGRPTRQQAEPTPVPRGKAMGGGSSINGAQFFRGSPEDFDDWAARGNDRWSFLKVLPYWRKMETDLDFQDDFHGTDGPVPVRRYKREEFLPFQGAFYQSCIGAGFQESSDINHPESTGVSPVPVNNLDGVRMSTALTYINPNRHRLNLTIKANVMVTKILFSGKAATGVEVESGQETFVVEGREIVLSAGAIKSPHLLMLSGVGPADQLNEFDIPVVCELPGVGQNMRDHPQVSMLLQAKDGVPMDPYAPKRECLLHYTSTGSSFRNDMLITPSSFATKMGGDPNESIGMSVSASIYKPAGTGEVRLASPDPHAQPHLDYQYLEDPWDRQRMREAGRLCVRLLENESYQDIVSMRLSPTDEELATDETLDRWIADSLRFSSTQHMSGTCKMGPASDPTAVVDQYRRVHGLEGLRVVDTSIMPDIVCTGTSGTAMMIGERVADLMKEQL